MNEPGTEGVLLDQKTLHDRLDDAPGWLQDHYRTFRESMLGERDDSPFPCYFGIEVEREGDLLYAACESTTDPAALLRLRDVLVEYLDAYADHADRAPLAVFFRPKAIPVSRTTTSGCGTSSSSSTSTTPSRGPTTFRPIRTPRASSSVSAAAAVPRPLAHRFYDERKSRYSPVGLEVTFQPRAVFDGLTADTEAGQHARETIRERMGEYDGSVPTPISATGASRATASGRSTCSARTTTRARYLSPLSDPQPPEGARGAVGAGRVASTRRVARARRRRVRDRGDRR